MKYKSTKPSENARPPHQFNLSQQELQDIFILSGDPNRLGSKGKALRTVIERHKDQINTIEVLHKHLKQLTAKEAAHND